MGNLGYLQVRGDPGKYEVHLKTGQSNETFELSKEQDLEVSSYITRHRRSGKNQKHQWTRGFTILRVNPRVHAFDRALERGFCRATRYLLYVSFCAGCRGPLGDLKGFLGDLQGTFKKPVGDLLWDLKGSAGDL